ncbi:RCN1 [Lemmus lemmus]
MARGSRLGLALGLLLALALTLRAKPTVRKERVVRPDSELGERPAEDNQSFQYDHEAFLGKEDSKTFDQLSPDESKERLGQFSDFRDLNKDGKLDKDEIRHWILPQDYDHAQAEARHLVYESDKNKVASMFRATD